MTTWNQALVVVDGYVSGETDFAARLARMQAEGQQRLVNLAHRVGRAAADPAAMCIVVIEGHSDRQDRADMNPEQRRASEYDASLKREVSAAQWFIDRVTEVAGPPGVDGYWSRIFVVRQVTGAAQLVAPGPGLAEVQRQQNRRVVISVYARDMAAVFPEDLEALEV